MKRQVFSKALIAVCAIAFLASQQTKADVLWDNGPVFNGIGNGFGGANTSVGTAAPAENVFGFGAQNGANNRIADDFIVTGPGWNVNTIRLYTYQTGSTTTSTITGVSLRILDGNPSGTPNTVFGSTTANAPLATGWTGAYRVLDNAITGSTRPIMFVDVDLSGLFLSAGTYYVDFNFTGSLASGPWAPPVAGFYPNGVGNALQGLAGVYGPANLGVAPSPVIQGAVPFIVNGTAIPEPGTLSVLALGAVIGMIRRRK